MSTRIKAKNPRKIVYFKEPCPVCASQMYKGGKLHINTHDGKKKEVTTALCTRCGYATIR